MASVQVDLAPEPLRREMQRRYDFLASCADELLHDGALDRGEVFLNEFELHRAVEAYFLLSEAYKADKLGHSDETPHWTEGPKKAAFTAISLMLFRPFRFLTPERALRHNMSLVANQLLVMTAAGSLLERDFPILRWETQRRLFLVFAEVGSAPKFKLRVRSLRHYIRDQKREDFKRQYAIDLAPDMLLINSFILLFESPLGS